MRECGLSYGFVIPYAPGEPLRFINISSWFPFKRVIKPTKTSDKNRTIINENKEQRQKLDSQFAEN